MVASAPSSLTAIGFDDFFQARLSALGEGFMPARIAIAHGESYVAWAEHGDVTAILAGSRARRWRQAIDRPQVGDWVAGTQPDATGPLHIAHVLERRTCLLRRAAGEREVAQVIAANVDVVGVVSALGEDTSDARTRRLVNEPRLQRYLAVVEQSGARPVLVINKSDLLEDAAAVADGLRVLFPGVPLVLTSGVAGVGLDGLEQWTSPGRTLALVGMSGVGKSTLVNALLGRSAQRTEAVREADARGRHTTTHRELFRLESGALLLDTPGMRELGLWEADGTGVFPDVLAIAATCRFSDCHHASEPGCAIRQALTDGVLSPERYAAYELQQAKVAGPQRHQRGGGARRGRQAGGARRKGP